MFIKNAKIRGKDGLYNILVKDGNFAKISQEEFSAQVQKTINAEGKLLLSPFIEPHIHLDAVLTSGEPEFNKSGTLFEGIERWSERKKLLTVEDVKERARKAIKWQVANGIGAIRTHVDVTDPKLIALSALLELKEELKNFVDLQLVAFPQEGILSYKNGVELLEEALKLGADCVGGIPHYEFTREYGVKSLEIAFNLACKYDKLIDIHCDEIDDEQSRFIEVVATLAYEREMGKKVSASHTTAMGSYNDAYACKLFRILELSKINFISNPLVNMHLQGRFDTYPKRRGLTRVKELHKAGINICFGHDDIQDPWYPLGTGNMLEVLSMGLHASQLTGQDDINSSLDFISSNSAKALNLSENFEIKEGKKANFIILDAKNDFEALAKRACVLYNVKNGKIIAQSQPSSSFITFEKEEKINFSR